MYDRITRCKTTGFIKSGDTSPRINHSVVFALDYQLRLADPDARGADCLHAHYIQVEKLCCKRQPFFYYSKNFIHKENLQ